MHGRGGPPLPARAMSARAVRHWRGTMRANAALLGDLHRQTLCPNRGPLAILLPLGNRRRPAMTPVPAVHVCAWCKGHWQVAWLNGMDHGAGLTCARVYGFVGAGARP